MLNLPLSNATPTSEHVGSKDTPETVQYDGNQQNGTTVGVKGWPLNLTFTNPEKEALYCEVYA